MKQRWIAIACAAVCSVSAGPAFAQQQAALDRDAQYRITQIMQDARDEVRKHYYDPKLHDIDWDARYQQYLSKALAAHDLGQAFRSVAAFLGGLNDSHVYFIPPYRKNEFDPSYKFELIGNDCFITQVRPKSDAASKLHIGDQVLKIDGFTVNRGDFHDIAYFFRILSPLPGAQLEIRSPDGSMHTVVVNHTVHTLRPIVDLTSVSEYFRFMRREMNEVEASRPRMIEHGDVAIWKLNEFDIDFMEVDHFIGIAKKHSGLVLDLRGNPGGEEESLQFILGFLFDHNVKIADRIRRKETKELTVKGQGKPFRGKLVVLVDAGSASASELLARVVQLEHRGTVMGDRTAGAVMEAQMFEESRGNQVRVFYAFSITDANLIMTDGKSLEKTGVTPDETFLPTAADLAAGRDTVLAHAVELAGGYIDPAEAGKLFPYQWVEF